MPRRISIVSGYFNPIHKGHIKLFQEARKLGELFVIVNNDTQQLMKKGTIIMSQDERVSIIRKNCDVSSVILSIDEDKSVCRTLERLALNHKKDRLIFANGGDRKSINDIPEAHLCKKYGIKMMFNVGGEKSNSSTNINQKIEQSAKCRICGNAAELDPFTMLCFRCYLKHYGAFNEPKRRKATKKLK